MIITSTLMDLELGLSSPDKIPREYFKEDMAYLIYFIFFIINAKLNACNT